MLRPSPMTGGRESLTETHGTHTEDITSLKPLLISQNQKLFPTPKTLIFPHQGSRSTIGVEDVTATLRCKPLATVSVRWKGWPAWPPWPKALLNVQDRPVKQALAFEDASGSLSLRRQPRGPSGQYIDVYMFGRFAAARTWFKDHFASACGASDDKTKMNVMD